MTASLLFPATPWAPYLIKEQRWIYFKRRRSGSAHIMSALGEFQRPSRGSGGKRISFNIHCHLIRRVRQNSVTKTRTPSPLLSITTSPQGRSDPCQTLSAYRRMSVTHESNAQLCAHIRTCKETTHFQGTKK